jgi:hypothetical protein
VVGATVVTVVTGVVLVMLAIGVPTNPAATKFVLRLVTKSVLVTATSPAVAVVAATWDATAMVIVITTARREATDAVMLSTKIDVDVVTLLLLLAKKAYVVL